MVNQVRAIGFTKEISFYSGASEPLVVRVVSESGEEFESYIKLTDKLPLKIKAIIIELIASILALDLGLLTPEPLIVTIDDEFINSVNIYNPTVAQRLRMSCRETFGTRALSGGRIFLPERGLESTEIQMAANIFIFDALIENVDRGGQGGKSNCLLDGLGFHLIDHEKAFASATVLILGRNTFPWDLGGLDRYATPGSHLFINELRKRAGKLNFNLLGIEWKELSNDRIEEYLRTLPSLWIGDPENAACARRILDLIKRARDNIDDCIAEIKRIIGV